MSNPTTPARPNDALSRRGFLAAATAGAAAAAAAPAVAQSAPGRGAAGSKRADKPRNLVLMISDGMSIGALQIAELVHQARHNSSTAWIDLYAMPGANQGLLDTTPEGGYVTDSAAAGTAFSTGRRTTNGALNTFAAAAPRTPMYLRAAERGYATGLVATAHVNHATPAAFLVNHTDRNAYHPIAKQMTERPCDVVLGGGSTWFTPELFQAAGITSVAHDRRSLARLAAAKTKSPLWGIFTPGHMSYDIDRPDTEPSIADMTRHALARLRALNKPFILMVEGARIDHAAHANDAVTLVNDQLAYDAALRVALDDARRTGDTLVITTTDHGNSNPGFCEYLQAGINKLRTLARTPAGFIAVNKKFRSLPEPQQNAAALANTVRDTMNIQLNARDITILDRALAGEPTAPDARRDTLECVLGAVLTPHIGVGFNTRNHTADHVPLAAWGPGAHAMPKLGHIADLHDAYCELLGVPAP